MKYNKDLVLLPSCSNNLNETEIKTVFDADWYLVTAKMDGNYIEILCAPANQVGNLSEDWLSETSIIKVVEIDDILKRWSFEDGFYSA